MKYLLLAIFTLLFSATSQATDSVSQRYIDQLSSGDKVIIKQVAVNIYRTGLNDTEVLDVSAEVLLERYPTAVDSDIDTLAWLSKALGSSGNPRYHTTLKEVANSNAHGKLRKYAKKALSQVGGPSGEQYVKGTINLAVLHNAEQPKRTSAVATTRTPTPHVSATKSSSRTGFDAVRVGMSIQEAYDLAGPPTHTARVRGKGRLLFNLKLKDFTRQLLLYRGVGRIACSDDVFSASRVLEVIIDPSEDGYP